ncbi:hypothetical protein [Amycolatopsis lexingtonensis]|uniref:hypothetical protein n=1 Tax=Amycolatopsis lexingtonensis TaxID=218822 RepID=UPI002011E486|nr:hypothetical protein [Amycolatopsis lexingtonensis]
MIGTCCVASVPRPAVTRIWPFVVVPGGTEAFGARPSRTVACSPGASARMAAGTVVRPPGTSTVTVTRSRAPSHTVPALTIVASAACGPPSVSRFAVDRPSSTSAERPTATGCRVSAKTCRLATFGAGFAVVGRVTATASRAGSTQTWPVASETGLLSTTPPGA